MNLQEINSTISKIKNKVYSPIYFLMGEETYYIDLISDILEKSILNANEKEFNQTVLYGKDSNVDEIISYCKRYPMMSEYQVIILKEAQDLSRTIEKFSEYMLNPSLSTVLIINYKYKTLDKRKKLFKNIQKFGIVLDCKKIYENKVSDWIVNQLKMEGYSINIKACQMLVDYLGNDLNKINNQLKKLRIICSNETDISPQNIHDHIGINKDYNIFELRNAIGTKNTIKALKISTYFTSNFKQYPIQMILSSLFNYFIQIFQYHSLNDKSDNNVSSKLGVNRFFVKDYIQASRLFSMKKISAIISLIKDSDLKTKGLGGSNSNDKDILRQLIIEIMN